jgi:hypothetical protein
VVTVSDDSLLTVTATPLRTTAGAARPPAAELERIAEILRLARATELDPPRLQAEATAAGARLEPTSPSSRNQPTRIDRRIDHLVRHLRPCHLEPAREHRRRRPRRHARRK